MKEHLTYTAVFRQGEERPLALFRNGGDVALFHQNPEVFVEGRRQLLFGESPIRVAAAVSEPEAVALLRSIVEGRDELLAVNLDIAKAFLGRFDERVGELLQFVLPVGERNERKSRYEIALAALKKQAEATAEMLDRKAQGLKQDRTHLNATWSIMSSYKEEIAAILKHSPKPIDETTIEDLAFLWSEGTPCSA